MKPTVFISHITEESKLAAILKDALQRDFLGMIDVFVSSDSVSIEVGSKWLNQLSTALESAEIEILLCSPNSVERPWVNFEAGAGWVKGIPVVPICHTGLRLVDLPIPLNMLHGIQATDTSGWTRLYSLVAARLTSSVPAGNHAALVEQIARFENEYGLVRVIRGAVKMLLELVPGLSDVLRPDPLHRAASGHVPELLLDKMIPHLNVLRDRRMIDWETGSAQMTFGPTGGGNEIELKIQVHSAYYGIAKQVMK